ncbi:MAG: hypothetical protein AB1324_05990 [Candidatus Micrarchaeota archaeon]
MQQTAQPMPSESLHDEFQGAELRLSPALERLWLGGRRASVVRMLSLRETVQSLEARWGARAEQDLGEFIMRFITEPPAQSGSGMDLPRLCSAMMEAELPALGRFVHDGTIPNGSGGIISRIRGETSDLHLLVYFKMLEHIAIASDDERLWRGAMMLMADASTVGASRERQEIASLCLERIMLVEGAKCGRIEANRHEAEAYPMPGDSGIVPSSGNGANGDSRLHEEKFDFARACIAESMFFLVPENQILGVNALALGQYRNAIGPMLALCVGIRLHEDPEKTPAGAGNAILRSLLLQHLSQARPLAGGDGDTLPAMGSHLQRTALLLMDPSRTMPPYSITDSLSAQSLELAHGELARLLDPKQILHPHPSYVFDAARGALLPAFPHAGLQQSALVSTAELALSGYRPAASTILRAMLELTGRFLPLTLSGEKPPRQVRESLGLLEMCIESLALAGIPGAKAMPMIFIHGNGRISQLKEEQIEELAVPALEMLRIQALLIGTMDAAHPLLLAARVVEADVEIRSMGAGRKAPDAFRDLMRRRDKAFGGSWDSFELPDTSLISPLARRMDERSEKRLKSADIVGSGPVFLLTRRKKGI